MGCSSPEWHTRQMPEHLRKTHKARHTKRKTKRNNKGNHRKPSRPVTSLAEQPSDGMRPDVSDPADVADAEYEDEGS